MNNESASILHMVFEIAEKNFAVFVAIFLLVRLDTRLNDLVLSVHKLVSAVTKYAPGRESETD